MKSKCLILAFARVNIVGYQHLPGFASFEGTDDAGCLELVHDTAGPVVADRKPPLDGRGGTLLGADYEPGCFFEQRTRDPGSMSLSRSLRFQVHIPVGQKHSDMTVGWQYGGVIASTSGVSTKAHCTVSSHYLPIQHITTSDQLVGTR